MHSELAGCYSGGAKAGFLIAKGADLDIQDENGNTALMIAVRKGYGHIQGAKRLIDRGANLDLKNKQGQTAEDIVRKEMRRQGMNY